MLANHFAPTNWDQYVNVIYNEIIQGEKITAMEITLVYPLTIINNLYYHYHFSLYSQLTA
jgi:hypothetical protein